MNTKMDSLTDEEKKDGALLGERLLLEKTKQFNEALGKEYKEAADYNNHIANHLPMYKEIEPNNYILIRFYRRLPKIINVGNTSLMVDEMSHFDYAKMQRQAASGSTYTQRQEPTQFKFLAKAIIVAKPDYYEKYEIGDVVCTLQPIIEGVMHDGGEAQVYSFYFLHPDSGLVIPPQTPSEHYGYALVSPDFIKGRISKAI